MQCLKHKQQCFIKFKNSRRSPRIFRLDKTRAVNQLQKRSVIRCFRFLIQLIIRMKFYIKSHVRLYKIICSLIFFLTSISFIRYKVTVMVQLYYELEISMRASPSLTIASLKLRASNLIVLVKTFSCLCLFWRKTCPSHLTRRYSKSIDQYIASSLANQIAGFAIVYD